jgi:excisionase family DNA binding protein
MDDHPTWMTVAEAARYARCGPKTLYREVRRGRLKAARVGGRREIRVRREWLDRWLEDCATREDGDQPVGRALEIVRQGHAA